MKGGRYMEYDKNELSLDHLEDVSGGVSYYELHPPTLRSKVKK